MDSGELKIRTKKFAIDVIKFVTRIKRRLETNILARQLIRSATSIGANYRSAYWLELIRDGKLANSKDLQPLIDEAKELTAIFTSIGKTAKICNPELANSKSANSQIQNSQSEIRYSQIRNS